MENKKLIIGYDLGSRYSKISWFNEKENTAENVCVIGSEGTTQIPSVLLRISEDTWLCGQAAVDAAAAGKGTLISGFTDRYETEPQIRAGGEVYEKKTLIAVYLRESLKMLETYFEVYAIAYMTISIREVSKKIMQDMTQMSYMFGVSKDCLRIQSHIASYEYFAMCQKKELWNHDVGMFLYDEDGLNYYHLFISKKRQPAVVRAQSYQLKMYMSGEMLDKESPVDLDRKFLDVLNEILSQKIISTIYLSGKGFQGTWMNESKRKLCSGRKVFYEDNIYAAGACYRSWLDVNKNQFKYFIAVNDDIVPASIYIKGSRMKEIVRHELTTGGSSWYSIDHTERFILDGTDTVVFRVRDFVTNVEKMIPLTLEGLPDRPDKTVTISLNVQFENANICCVTMRDEGFGGIFPSTKRVWKKRINVAEYECDKNFKEHGRLIFGKELNDKVPYYFNFTNTKIYSLEELCYYVYNNIYAVTMDTFGEELFYWIDKTLMEPALAKGFKNLKKTGASFKMMVQHLMSYADYYSHEECVRLNDVLDEIEHQNPIEIRKIQADNLVRYCRYMDAISGYMTVIGQMEQADASDITNQFKGNVYHNLGAAYMRVMNFESAASSYKRAYSLNKNTESLKCYLWALKMDGDESGFFDAASEYHLSENFIEEVLKIYDKTAGSVSMGQRPDNNEAVKVLKRLKSVYRN